LGDSRLTSDPRVGAIDRDHGIRSLADMMRPDQHAGILTHSIAPEILMNSVTPRSPWWLIPLGLLRAAVTVAVMVALYYVLPLHAQSAGYLIVELMLGLGVFAAMIAWQVRAITRSKRPRIRATQALATADGEGLVGAIYAATATIFGATNGMPDTLWVAPDVWGSIGSLSDSTGRQLFPTVNPSNALGSISPTSMTGSVAGMRLVVDKHLPAGTAILGDSTYVETYETIGGQVSVIEPSVLGTQMAFYG